MNKREFYKQLKSSLKSFNSAEIDKIIDFYDELIDEKMEAGMTEEQAIASFGDIKNIINGVTADLVIERSDNKNYKEIKNFFIILGICASPILLPLGIAFFAIFLSIIIVFLSLLLSFSISSIAVLLSIIPMIMEMNSSGTDASAIMISVGAALLTSGILMIFTIITFKTGKILLNGVNKIFSKIIKRKSEEKQNENN